MRDYLYIWHDPQLQFIVTSGVEFKDFVSFLSKQGGLILLEHKSDTAEHDDESNFDFVPKTGISQLAQESICSWGNFAWIDYGTPNFPSMSPNEIAELLYFAHQKTPLHKSVIQSVRNRFLCYMHDDGWYMRLYYTNWKELTDVLSDMISPKIGVIDFNELLDGKHAFWLESGKSNKEEKTFNIDSILNRRLAK